MPYVIEGPDGPLYADFHALRHTFLPLLGRNGVDLRTSQELAGHSSPLQTVRYSYRGLDDLAKAVQKLPSFLPGTRVKNGTNSPPENVCPPLDQVGSSSGHREIGAVSDDGRTPPALKKTQPLENQGFGQRQSPVVRSVHKRGRRDSNPQPPDRQFHSVQGFSMDVTHCCLR